MGRAPKKILVVDDEAQIRKFASRRDVVAARRDILRRRLMALTASCKPGGSAELQRAQREEGSQLRQLMAQQEEWFRMNRVLELRARRNFFSKP